MSTSRVIGGVVACIAVFGGVAAAAPTDDNVDDEVKRSFLTWSSATQGLILRALACNDDTLVTCYGITASNESFGATRDENSGEWTPLVPFGGVAGAPVQTAPASPASAPSSFTIERVGSMTVRDFLDLEFVCVDFMAVNVGSVVAAPTGSFWVIRPSGTVFPEWPMGVILEGQVAPINSWFPLVVPGAESRATKCFSTEGERGTFTIQYVEATGALSWQIDVL